MEDIHFLKSTDSLQIGYLEVFAVADHESEAEFMIARFGSSWVFHFSVPSNITKRVVLDDQIDIKNCKNFVLPGIYRRK